MMPTPLSKTGWGTPKEYAQERLPGVPHSDRRCRDALLRLAGEHHQGGDLQRKRQGTKAQEFHFSLLPQEAVAALAKRYPEIALLGGFCPLETPIQEELKDSFDSSAAWANYERKSQAAKDRAAMRLKALDMVNVLLRNGWKKKTAKEKVVEQFQREMKISFNALGNWMKQVKDIPRADWLPVLADNYAGRVKETEIPVEAWDQFKGDYLRLSAPTSQACYDRLQRVAKREGWELPSVKTFVRRLEKEIPRPVLILAREGEEALKHSFPAQCRDHRTLHALEAVNADGHRFDVFVKFPDGEIVRPIAVAWQDVYSGKFLSYRVSKTENSDLVRLSFGDMVEVYGLPGSAYLDNGRAFAAKFLTGGTPTRFRFKIKEEDPAGILTALLGQENIHWCTPYHGQAKPIERAFRDLAERVSKHPHFEGAYTGNKPDAKPENYGSRAIPFEEFMTILDQEMVAHNSREGRRSPVCAGRSFDQAFAESYASAPIRKATAEQRRLWLLAAEGVNASKRDGSISLLGNRYYADCLASLAGQKLVVRFDPDNLHTAIHVYRLDGSYIGQADFLPSAGFADTQAAREHSRLRNQYKKAAREQLKRERRINALEVAKRLPEMEAPELPDSKVIQPLFKGSPSDRVNEEEVGERVASSLDKLMSSGVRFVRESQSLLE